MTLALLVGCAGHNTAIKPAEVLDQRTGMTMGALQDPIEFVENSPNAALSTDKRPSFAYLGPIEWDRMGEISYALWVHVAPGNDSQVGDIHAGGAVTLNLDDGALVLLPMDAPTSGRGPYRPVASWGQTGYFQLDVQTLKRLASSKKLGLNFRGIGDFRVDFQPTHDTSATLTQFLSARGITAD